MKTYFCACGKKICKNTALYGKGRCNLCSHQGENNGNYKDGITAEKYFCIDCGTKVSLDSGLYGQKRCKTCAKIGKLNSSFIDNRTNIKHYCFGCGQELIDYRATYCKKCGNKQKSIVKHHIYLKENSNEIIKINQGKHSKLHTRAYEYIYFLLN